MTTLDSKNNKDKMIETCQAILDSCDKPFVWDEQDTYEYGDYKKPFNLLFPEKQIEKELNDLFEKFTGSKHLHDQIMQICNLDKQWSEHGTYGLDRNINIVFSQYTLKPQYVKEVRSYFNERLSDLLKSE